MVFPTKDVYVTADFGKPGSWAAGYHTGIDYRAPVGTPIHATKRGKVVHAGWGGYGSAYGCHVVIESWYNGRKRRHLYAHLTDENVYVGKKVRTGDIVGRSGVTGNVTGPHLHYEERVSPFGYYDHVRPVFPNLKFPIRRKVSLSKVKPGKRNNHVKRVQRRLNKKFRGLDKLALNGYYSPKMKERYARWQKRLGYEGKDANGVAGRTSLEKLGFKVVP